MASTFLEVLLERLERFEVARQRPFEEVRQEPEAVEETHGARSFGELAETIHDFDRPVVERHEPPLGDEAVDSGRPPIVGEPEHRDMEIAAVIDEPRLRPVVAEVVCGATVEIERVDHAREIVIGRLLEVDPENRRTPHSRKRIRPVDLVDPISIEEQRRGHSILVPSPVPA